MNAWFSVFGWLIGLVAQSLSFLLIAFCCALGTGCGGGMVLFGLYRLIRALKSRSVAGAVASMLLIASSVFIVAVQVVAFPVLELICIDLLSSSHDLEKVVGGRSAALSIIVTASVWIAIVAWCLAKLGGLRRIRSSVVTLYRVGLRAGTKASLGPYRAGELSPVLAAAPNSGRGFFAEVGAASRALWRAHQPPASPPPYDSALEDVRTACAFLALHGLVMTTPFLASRASSLLFGTISPPTLRTDPSVMVGAPIVAGSLGLFLLRFALQGRGRKLDSLLGGTAVVFACFGVMWWIAGGHLPLTWTMNHPVLRGGGDEEVETLPDFVGRELIRDGSSHGSGIMGRELSCAVKLAPLLQINALLFFAVTLAALLVKLRLHSRGKWL
jgi:hypothetical protein